MKISSLLKHASVKRLVEYGNDNDLADALEMELKKYVSGASNTNKNEIQFYELYNHGDLFNAEIIVNPTNQPKEATIVKIGLFMVMENGAVMADVTHSYKITTTIHEVAREIGESIKHRVSNIHMIASNDYEIILAKDVKKEFVIEIPGLNGKTFQKVVTINFVTNPEKILINKYPFEPDAEIKKKK